MSTPTPLQQRFVKSVFGNQSISDQMIEEETLTSPLQRALYEEQVLDVLRRAAYPLTEEEVFERAGSRFWPDWTLARLQAKGKAVMSRRVNKNSMVLGTYTPVWSAKHRPLRPYFGDDGTFIHDK